MNKRILASILSAALLCSAFGVYADEPLAEAEAEIAAEEVVDYELMADPAGTFYEEFGVWFDKSTGTVTGADVLRTDFVIADKIDDVAVKTIGYHAFYNCVQATSIVLPDTITGISYRAFENCTALKEITIPANAGAVVYSPSYGNNYYGSWFYGCTSLEKVTFADGAQKVPGYAFDGCSTTKLTGKNIIIPDSVTSIGGYAFRNCTQLTAIPVAKNVTTLGEYSFSGCKALKEISNLPSVITIGNYAFNGCETLTEVTALPDSVETIGNFAFKGCNHVKTVDLESNRIKSIGAYAFSGCIALETAKLPTVLTQLGYRVFENCTNPEFKELVIPSNADAVVYSPSYGNNYYGSWIYGCSSMEKVTFADGAIKIPRYAFDGCGNCAKLTYDNIIIPDTVTSVGDHAFKNCTQLTELPVMNGVKSIGAYAFEANSSLESLKNIPPRLETIGDGAFMSCSSKKFTEFTLPRTVTSIGYTAFSGCSKVEKVDIANTRIDSIGAFAFSECNSLTSIDLPTRLTKLGYRVLNNCTQLKELVIPANADAVVYSPSYGTNYYGSWIYGCSSLEKLTFADGAKKIANFAFDGCGNAGLLKNLNEDNIIIPDTVTTIGEYAFRNCTQLREIPTMDGVTSIGQYAFYGCEGLTTLDNLPDTLTTIGNYAFYGCKGLSKIRALPPELTSIGQYAFANCTELLRVILPSKLKTIGNNAFNNCGDVEYIFVPASVQTIGTNVFLKDYYLTVYGLATTPIETYASNQTNIDAQQYIGFETVTEIPVDHVPVTAVSILLKTADINLEVGDSTTLPAKVRPALATNKKISWSSTDEAVAVVEENGKVTAKSGGEATIAATADDTTEGTHTASRKIIVPGSAPSATTAPTALPTAEPTTLPTAEPYNYPYEIKGISIKSESGETLEAVPANEAFIVDMQLIKKQPRENRDYLFVAVYDKDGVLLSLDYVQAQFIENYDFSFGFYVPSQAKEIGTIKAFVWNSFSSFEPLAENKVI